jgi:hypothetical protein
MTGTYIGYFLIAFIYYFLAILVSLSIFLIGDSAVLTSDSFIYFDAEHYLNIRDNGYKARYESAFFPLAPFIWKALNLGVWGISAFNGLLYMLAVSVIGRVFRFDLMNYLVILAIPSAVFFFIPYSEAVFYVCGLTVLLGIRMKNPALQLVGIFLCCVARPTLPVVASAFVVYQLYNGERKLALYGVLASLSGTFAAFTIHWLYTDDLFSYFSAFKTWNYNFRFPLLPFRSDGGNAIKQYDSYALLFGLIAIALAIRVLRGTVSVSKEMNFSYLYLAAFTLLILGLLRGGNLTSLNRFLFCSPFFALVLYHISKEAIPKKGWKTFLIVLVSFLLFSFLFSSFVHIQTFLRYAAGALIVAAFISIDHLVIYRVNVTRTLFLVALIATQLFMFVKFYRGDWIG